MFLGTGSSRGIGDYDDYYQTMCDDENCVPINFSDFVAFAEEANGSLSMYNPCNGNVLLFSHDQNFDYVEFMEEQPQYTFHTFKGIVTFVNYVEEVANQWLNAIK
jgi:hypothetical protein